MKFGYRKITCSLLFYKADLIGAEELGAWKEERAKDMQPDRERRTWSVSLALKPHETVDYKYIRVSEEHGQVVAARWEDGPNSQNRQFYWNGSSTVEDAGEISSFGAVQPLKQTYYGKEPGKRTVAVAVIVFSKKCWW